MSFATTPKQVLIAAKWMIENVGWCQGELYKNQLGHATTYGGPNKVCSMCLVGAVEAVEAITPLKEQAYAALRTVIGRTGVSIAFGTLVDFNDDEYTTKQDVLFLLDSAIQECDNPH